MSLPRKRKCLRLLSGLLHGCKNGDAELEDDLSPIPDGKRPKLYSPGEEAEKD